jgi:hypothetical protein
MSLLTEQEIENLYYTELDRRELSFARAVEAKVIEKIKAQRPVSVETLTSSGKRTDRYYYLPEGD